MITVLYFARFREKLGKDRELLALPPGTPATVQMLLHELSLRGDVWAELLGSGQGVLVAVNQAMATPDSSLCDGDEVAIFPAVTGG